MTLLNFIMISKIIINVIPSSKLVSFHVLATISTLANPKLSMATGVVRLFFWDPITSCSTISPTTIPITLATTITTIY